MYAIADAVSSVATEGGGGKEMEARERCRNASQLGATKEERQRERKGERNGRCRNAGPSVECERQVGLEGNRRGSC